MYVHGMCKKVCVDIYTVAITYHNVGVHPLVSRCDNCVQLSGLLGTRLLIPDTQVSSIIYITNGT